MVESPLNFGGLEEPFSNYDQARFVVVPVPYEKTTTYGKGTLNGPLAILEASGNMELFDEELRVNTAESGIATLDPLSVDCSPEDMVDAVKNACLKVLSDGKFPVVLGGEHSVSLGFFLALREHYGSFTVLQFDAHSDLRDSYEGTAYSHACVMRRICEYTNDVVQVGIRSLCDEEAEFLSERDNKVFYAHEMVDGDYVGDIVRRLSDSVYITFDVDFLDPSIMPSTGTPEPGGFGWYETLEILRTVAGERRIVGLDVTELSPTVNKAPDFTVAKLVYRLMGYVGAGGI